MVNKDPGKAHFYYSIAKSIVRIIAGGALIFGAWQVAGALFICAECLGILEEL